jgi:hypothetical protein
MAKEIKHLCGLGRHVRYAVTSDGEVLSCRRTGVLRKLQPQLSRHGYLKVMIGRKNRTVHGLVALAFLGERPPNFDINHKNGVKTDNRPENLEYCTTSQNCRHAEMLGLVNHAKGSRHPRASLTDEKVREIRRLLSIGVPQVEIAKRVGTRQPNVSRISCHRTWRHVR